MPPKPLRPMPQSLAQILLHLIFSTKDRTPCIIPSIRPQLHAYLAAIVRSSGCECLRVGGVADHVHLAIRFSRTATVAKLVNELKTDSAKWVKTQTTELRNFAWQHGYGVFSVGPQDAESLVGYIDNQEEHHRKKRFRKNIVCFCRNIRSGTTNNICGTEQNGADFQPACFLYNEPSPCGLG